MPQPVLPSDPPPSAVPPAPRLVVRDREGRDVELVLEPHVAVVLMATWCPHSAPLRDLLRTCRDTAGFAGLRLVFLFEDEWPRVREVLAREPGASPERFETQLSAVRAAKGGGPLVVPDFVDQCAAEILYVHPDHPLPGAGVPRLIARDGRVQPETVTGWLAERLRS